MKGPFLFMEKRKEFKKWRDEGKTLKFLMKLLSISKRTSIRWNKEWKDKTIERPHALVGKKGNKKSTIEKEKILRDYILLNQNITRDGKTDPYNFSYYVRKKLNQKCSLTTFKKIMSNNFIASPWARKNTKLNYINQLKLIRKNTKNKNKLHTINQALVWNKRDYIRKPRVEYEGALNEIDACKDYWLSNKYSHLHLSYDPSVRKIRAGWFEKEETTHGYYQLLKQQLKHNIVPQLFKGDCRSTFVVNKKDAGALAHKDVNTQYGFTLRMLGVKMKNSSEPTFKGSVERVFRTLQNQLKCELKERNRNTIDSRLIKFKIKNDHFMRKSFFYYQKQAY